MNDISTFMTWWINQVINIFTFIFNTLNNITFSGTSLLKVILGIIFFGTLIPIMATLGKNSAQLSNKAIGYKSKTKGERRRNGK